MVRLHTWRSCTTKDTGIKCSNLLHFCPTYFARLTAQRRLNTETMWTGRASFPCSLPPVKWDWELEDIITWKTSRLPHSPRSCAYLMELREQSYSCYFQVPCLCLYVLTLCLSSLTLFLCTALLFTFGEAPVLAFICYSVCPYADLLSCIKIWIEKKRGKVWPKCS